MRLEIKSKHIIGLLILSLIWATNYSFVRIADQTIAPLTVMAGRGISASLFLLIVLLIRRKPILFAFTQLKLQFTTALCGLLIAYMWFTMGKSETVLTASMTSLLIALLPVFAWLIATFIYREKPFYVVNFYGILVALLGTAVMLGIDEILHSNGDILYAGLYASGLFIFTLSAGMSSRYCRQADAFLIVSLTVFYSAIFLTIAAFLFEQPLATHYNSFAIISIVGIGILCTGIGYLIYFWLVAEAGQVFAATNGYLVPIFGFALGVLLLHEAAYWHQVFGLLIVFIGVYLTNRRKDCPAI